MWSHMQFYNQYHAYKYSFTYLHHPEKEPGQLFNTAHGYSIPPEARQGYERQLTKWVTNGWLVPYDERVHGQPKGTIPLMAVVQTNRQSAPGHGFQKVE